MLRTLLGSILAFCVVTPLPQPAFGASPTDADLEISRALQARAYDRAVQLIDEALPTADQDTREGLLYRRGLALLYAGKHTEAIAEFARQLEAFPDGAWAEKARFRQADAHAALKQFEQAERIYGECVAALVGSARKAEIARVYLEFAEEYFAPKDTLSRPNYERARKFYERALELEPGESLRDDLMFKRAVCSQKLGGWDDAAAQYEEYLTVFDPEYRRLEKERRGSVPLPAAATAAGRHFVAARLGLAESRLAQGRNVDARRAGQDLLALLETTDPQREQHGQTWIKATYLLAKTYGMPTPNESESLALGVETLEKLLGAVPECEQAIRAAHEIGLAYAHLGRNDEAIAALQALMSRDVIRPDSDETRKLAEELSQQALFRVGQLYLAQKKYTEAIGAWNQYVAKYPTGPHWSAAQQAIVDAEYRIGADAYEAKDYDAARQTWTQFLQKYPLDERARSILYLFGRMAYQEEVDRAAAGQQPDWNQPLTHWRRLVNKFPQSEEAGLAQYEIGRVLEEKIQDLEAAIAAYRKLDWSSRAERAKQRIAAMRSTRLLLRTPRTFRTDETALVRVDIRNIDKLTVKLYRIDMRDYFRKSHGLGGVERLDLLLIDPDRTFEVAVDGYERYKPVTQEIEIPFEGPGVYAVNVCNETSEAEVPEGGPIARIEATTLLVRSDIDVIIKSSRRQVLVFAEDMRTQQPAAGVGVLISDGSKVRFEGQTGEDGVWLKKSDDLKNIERLSVFAERDGHVAGNALVLQGLEFSSGLQPRGYLYTDRPAYRPAEAVNIRGILREVKEGQYCLPTQPEDERLRWKLDVVDSKGRVLRTEVLEFTEFGSFATQFRVVADAPVGDYRLIVHRPDGPTFSGAFHVATYDLPKAVLRFELEEPVVMRGQKIKGTLVASYTYGEPVVGKTVEYLMHLWTGETVQRTDVTDEEGKIAFEFDSTLFPEEGRVVLEARQADLDIAAQGTQFIAVRAFRATVRPVRPQAVFLAEEPIELMVETKDLEGEPLGRAMTLSALRRTRTPNGWAETKVEAVELTTDEKTGVGRTALRLEKGGSYVVRVAGPDRFGHSVLAETFVQVSDDEDATRIRLFSDRQHYKVGETIALNVHSRLGVKGRHEGTGVRRHEGTEARRHEGAGRRESEPRARATGPRSEPEARATGAQSEPRARATGPQSEPEAPARVNAANRAPDTYLALVTYEGEEIIGYRTLMLAGGHNPLDIPVTHAHFPNFAVGVTVMQAGSGPDAGRLHAATREFTVERQLNITLTPNKQTYSPREELTLEIAVTDQQGQPVETEVGLAMIDSALLSRYPDPTPPIVGFFQEGAYRRAALRTETSCTFRYAAQTRPMVTELLAEARREESEATRVASSVERQSEAWQELRAEVPVADAATTKVFRLDNVDAEALGDVVRDIFESRQAGRQARGRPLRISVGPQRNSLIVAAPEDQLAEIRDFVQSLDSPLSNAARLDPGQALNMQYQAGRHGGLRGGAGAIQGQLLQSTQPNDMPSLGDRPMLGERMYGLYYSNGDGVVDKRGYLGLGRTVERYQARKQVQERLWDFNAQAARCGYGVFKHAAVEFNEALQAAPPRTYFPEVAYWNPRIATDADGKATVKIIVPDASTKWKFVARGVTAETLVGSGEAEVLSKHDFFVELITPPTLMEGDKFEPRALVHCLTEYEGKVDVTLCVKARRHEGTKARSESERGAQATGPQSDSRARATGPGSEPEAPARVVATQTKTIDVAGTGTFDVTFDAIKVAEPGEVVFELTAETQDAAEEERPTRGSAATGRPVRGPAATGRPVRGPAATRRKLVDATAREVPVRPWGMPVEVHAAGVGHDSDFVEIALPPVGDPQREYHDTALTVAVGPSMQRWLIEEALERGPRWRFIEHQLAASRIAPPRTHADTASSLLGCLYTTHYVQSQEGTAGGADSRLLDERIGGLVAQLLAAQGDDGGWSWCGAQSGSDPWTSAHIAWALGKAREDGYPVAADAVERLVNYLRKIFADADPSQHELKAIVLHGLSWLTEVDFAHVNRLHRSRETLSTAALGHLALTFVRLDRKSAAMEVLAVLDRQMREIRGGPRPACCLPNTGNSAWMNSELEVSALALLAQLSVDPRAASVPKLVNYLTGAARADGWRPHKARGSVLAALATYYASGEQQAANYTLTISVNGQELRRLTSDDTGSVRIDLAETELKPGGQRIDFAFAGRGEYAYAVTLRAFSRGFPGHDELRPDVLLALDRRTWPPPREYKGRAVPSGFSVTRRYDWFRSEAHNLPVGQIATVEVGLVRYDRSDNVAGDRDYVIVKETIPAGFRLLRETVRGEFLAYDYADNVLTLYYGSRRALGTLQYQMVAATPGEYRLPPAVIRSLYRPGIVHVNKEGKLTVLARGSQSPDEYRLTPDELYNLGRLHFDDGDYATASAHLEALLAGRWLLKDEPYREAVRMLLTAALDRDDADAIVNYFEILKEKYADLVIPFEQIIAVAQAYARTGQHERAYLIYRATADASFVRDAAVGGTLQDEGRFLESIDFLENLWRAYPDTPQVESTYYALSQTLYARAAQPESVQPRREAGAGAGRDYVTRDDIIRETIQLLERFLALYPESPVADEASYSLANALLDLDEYATVIARADEFVERYPKSKWLDRFRYIQALALFHLGEFERASELAAQVAEATYRDEQGVERPSPNKWLALYIIGQIYHAQNRTADAIEYYKKVRERFSDADEAISLFEQRFVRLPEVTVFHPDEGGFREADEWAKYLKRRPAERPTEAAAPPAAECPEYTAPFVRLDYRNIKSAVLQVYRVDLMKLALIEKNLSEITAVNLAGIKPILERTVELGDGHDYVDKSKRVDIEVPGDAAEDDSGRTGAGAYLVICRGDDLFSSGLVLVTPLAIDVQEDVAAQRARVSVVDAITRRGLRDVHVKVIGDAMQRFVDGESDLRGVFVAEDVEGYPTAVARDAAGHFAFHRSAGAVLAMARTEIQTATGVKVPAEKAGQTDYRYNLQDENRQIQMGNEARLKGMFQQQQKGVKVKASH